MQLSTIIMSTSQKQIIPAAAYRYIRLTMLEGPKYVTLTEVEMYESLTGTNYARNATASASSVYAGYSINGPIDGLNDYQYNAINTWCPQEPSNPNPNGSVFWGVDFGVVRPIKYVKIACGTFYNRAPTKIGIMGSNNNSTWTLIQTIGPDAVWTSNNFNTYVL